MIGGADRILQKSGILVGVGMARLRTEILNVIFWNVVGIRTQWRQQQPPLLWFESEGVHFNGIENVFSARLRREIVIDPGEQGVAAKFPGVALAFQADGVGNMQTMLACLTRQDI